VKKVIERLEEARSDLVKFSRDDSKAGLAMNALSNIEHVLYELEAPPSRNSDEVRRVQCNWCESVFDEEHIKAADDVEYCPVCGETGYLMDVPEAESPPRWETPEQREKRTGKKWPDNWPVWALISLLHGELIWEVMSYDTATSAAEYIVCATEAGPPPDGWRPEEE
jgi:hypothetical protein